MHTTLSQEICAPGLIKNIEDDGKYSFLSLLMLSVCLPFDVFHKYLMNTILSIEGTIYAKTWKCLPSYGAPGDTYVYFDLKKGNNVTVASALSKAHAVSPAWQCLTSHEDSEWCDNQQI